MVDDLYYNPIDLETIDGTHNMLNRRVWFMEYVTDAVLSFNDTVHGGLNLEVKDFADVSDIFTDDVFYELASLNQKIYVVLYKISTDIYDQLMDGP